MNCIENQVGSKAQQLEYLKSDVVLTLLSVDDLLVAVKAFFGEDKDAPAAKRSAHARPSREPAEAKRGLAES